MSKTLTRLGLAAAAFLFALSPFAASAQLALPPTQMISQASGNCLTLKAPGQSDGGGLTTAPCQNSPNFLVTQAGRTGAFELQFRLDNNTRFVCIFATDNPVVSPPPQHAKVETRNCAPPGGPVPTPSMWNVRGPDNAGFQQVEKLRNNIDSSNFCIFEDTQDAPTPEIILDVCQGTKSENWKFNSPQ